MPLLFLKFIHSEIEETSVSCIAKIVTIFKRMHSGVLLLLHIY